MKVNAIVVKAIVFCVSYVCMQTYVACADDTEQLQRRLYLRQAAISMIGDTWNNLSKQTKEDFIVGLRNNGLSEEDVCDIVSVLNGVKSNAAVVARSSQKSQSRNFGGNHHNEACRPNGTAFGFHGNNPYGEYVPVVGTGNTGIGVQSYNQQSEQLGSPLNGVKSNATVDACSSQRPRSRDFGGNQHNEAYRPNGTAFGFHGNNPYGEYVPVVGTGNTGIGVPSYNQQSEQLGSPGMWFPDYNEYCPNGISPYRKQEDELDKELKRTGDWNAYCKARQEQWKREKMIQDMRTMSLNTRHMENQGELQAIMYENKVREDMKQMHELEIDRMTGTTKAERKTMADNNLEEVYHRGAYSIADRLKRNRDTGELYYVDDDGSIKKIYINGVPAKLDQ